MVIVGLAVTVEPVAELKLEDGDQTNGLSPPAVAVKIVDSPLQIVMLGLSEIKPLQSKGGLVDVDFNSSGPIRTLACKAEIVEIE